MYRRITPMIAFAAAALAIAFPATSQTRYRFDPAKYSGEISNDGTQLANDYDTSTGATIGGFITSRGVRVDFSVPGSFDTEANAINNAGTIVGDYDDPVDFSFLGAYVRYADGTISTYSYPGAIETTFLAVNNAGTVIGEYYDGVNSGQFLLRKNGKLQDITSQTIYWTSLNNDETLLGYQFDPVTSTETVVVSHHTTLETVSIPGSISITAGTINNRGDVCGSYQDPLSVSHGFVRDSKGKITTIDDHVSWPATKSINFAGLGEATLTFVRDLGTTVSSNNDRGQLVGQTSASYVGIIHGSFGDFFLLYEDARLFIATPLGNGP